MKPAYRVWSRWTRMKLCAWRQCNLVLHQLQNTQRNRQE
jgi:hypothetical protein